MTNARFDALFGGPPRKPDELLTRHHMDIAASIQAVTDEAVLRLTRAIAAETRLPNLCLAGGVALNCVANGKVLRDRQFERLWIQPAAGDAGGALGAALSAYHLFAAQPRVPQNRLDAMQGSYLGPSFTQEDIEGRLKKLGAAFSVLHDPELVAATVGALVDSQAVGWFQGRMEFGPRALGARSILGDPRSPTMQSVLNLKVKHRESFRPFAPSVLAEEAGEWFDLDTESPYMLIVADVAHRHRRVMTPAEQ
jgi:carbamoyltransferase